MSRADQIAQQFTTRLASLITSPSLNTLLESHLNTIVHDADQFSPHRLSQEIDGLVLQITSNLPKQFPEELAGRLRGVPSTSHLPIFDTGMSRIPKPPFQSSDKRALANSTSQHPGPALQQTVQA
jgi:hypothetical protein